MTMIRSDKPRLQQKPSPSAQPSVAGASVSLRILAVVDGSQATNHVVEYLTQLAAGGNSIEAVVLNVQEKRDDRLRGYDNFKREEIEDRVRRDIGMPIADSVARRLEKAGIRPESRIEFGEPIEVMLRCAEEENCDMLVIGQKPAGAFARFLARNLHMSVGSLAGSLAVLAPLPVVVAR